MLLGYNTNGWAHHDPLDALQILSEIGYRSAAITLDFGRLNPFADDWPKQQALAADTLQRCELRSVVETGARYLLDPRRKHQPTLISPSPGERRQRLAFLKRAVDIAAAWGSDAVSFWSGAAVDDAEPEVCLERLSAGLRELLDYAGERNVCLAFEPEPGMFVDSMSRFERLLQWVESPQLKLTLDIGHLYCQGEVPLAGYIERWAGRIANVHIEDMRAGVHEHLMFGEGEMEFQPIIDALAAAGYRGALHVELSRHSHMAPQAARQAFDFLAPLVKRAGKR